MYLRMSRDGMRTEVLRNLQRAVICLQKRSCINNAGRYAGGDVCPLGFLPIGYGCPDIIMLKGNDQFKEAKKYVKLNDWKGAAKVWSKYTTSLDPKIAGRAWSQYGTCCGNGGGTSGGH